MFYYHRQSTSAEWSFSSQFLFHLQYPSTYQAQINGLQCLNAWKAIIIIRWQIPFNFVWHANVVAKHVVIKIYAWSASLATVIMKLLLPALDVRYIHLSLYMQIFFYPLFYMFIFFLTLIDILRLMWIKRRSHQMYLMLKRLLLCWFQWNLMLIMWRWVC